MSCAPLPEVPTLHAWVDESLIQRPGARAYLLAGVLADISRVDELRSTLRSLRTGNEAKLHWRTEDHRRRTKLACAVAELHVASIVVVGTPMDQPERADASAWRPCFPGCSPPGRNGYGVRRELPPKTGSTENTSPRWSVEGSSPRRSGSSPSSPTRSQCCGCPTWWPARSTQLNRAAVRTWKH